jgi:hypothetical protein
MDEACPINGTAGASSARGETFITTIGVTGTGDKVTAFGLATALAAAAFAFRAAPKAPSGAKFANVRAIVPNKTTSAASPAM